MGSEPAIYPRALNLDRSRALTIEWEDGSENVIPLAELRQACPCAECRARREAAPAPSSVQGLPVISAQASLGQQVTAETAELIGHYALRIRWQDGHDAGMFDFELLRTLGNASKPKP